MNKHMDDMRPKLEEMGEQEARLRLKSGSFQGYKKAAVEEWLLERDRERDAAVEASQAEIAREASAAATRAADAAERAAEASERQAAAAETANRRAIAALIIATAAAIVTVIELFQ